QDVITRQKTQLIPDLARQASSRRYACNTQRLAPYHIKRNERCRNGNEKRKGQLHSLRPPLLLRKRGIEAGATHVCYEKSRDWSASSSKSSPNVPGIKLMRL